MPLLKQIDPPEQQEDQSSRHTGFIGFAERALGLLPSFVTGSPAKKDPREDIPRVGEFYADYSALTPEEIAETDPACEELFRTSRPVSR